MGFISLLGSLHKSFLVITLPSMSVQAIRVLHQSVGYSTCSKVSVRFVSS